jgi:hypothetical protein
MIFDFWFVLNRRRLGRIFTRLQLSGLVSRAGCWDAGTPVERSPWLVPLGRLVLVASPEEEEGNSERAYSPFLCKRELELYQLVCVF